MLLHQTHNIIDFNTPVVFLTYQPKLVSTSCSLTTVAVCIICFLRDKQDHVQSKVRSQISVSLMPLDFEMGVTLISHTFLKCIQYPFENHVAVCISSNIHNNGHLLSHGMCCFMTVMWQISSSLLICNSSVDWWRTSKGGGSIHVIINLG